MKHRLLVAVALAAVGCAHRAEPHQASAPAPFCAAPVTPTGEASAGVTGPLHALNEAFLEAHANARSERCAYLEHEGLALRYAEGTFEARLHGRVLQPASSVLPPAYHPLKDVSHALLLAALTVTQSDTATKHANATRAVRAVDAVLADLAKPESESAKWFTSELRERQVRILSQSKAALLAPNMEAARAALGLAHEDLEQNLTLAATGTLEGLHAAVQGVRQRVRELDPDAWDGVLIVVSVAHQARAEALEVQYFERLLREPVKEGARGERRLIVVENVPDAPAQYGAIAAHLVDQRLGALFFADRTRMQRDVLSGYAQALDRLLPPLSSGP